MPDSALDGRWVLAGDLRAGDEVVLRDGAVVHVNAVDVAPAEEVVAKPKATPPVASSMISGRKTVADERQKAYNDD